MVGLWQYSEGVEQLTQSTKTVDEHENKAKNSELSEQNVKSSHEVLGKQLSEAVALGSYELKRDDAATNAVKSKPQNKIQL